MDALSLALERPVLLDDAELRPLAYSTQWGEIDAVRSESIMHRGASPPVRRALQAQGIAQARGILRTRAEPDISMDERVCAPVRSERNLLGYLWLLDAHHELDDEQLERIATTARRVAQVLDAPVRRPVDEGTLIGAARARRTRASGRRRSPRCASAGCCRTGRSSSARSRRAARAPKRSSRRSGWSAGCPPATC